MSVNLMKSAGEMRPSLLSGHRRVGWGLGSAHFRFLGEKKGKEKRIMLILYRYINIFQETVTSSQS